MEAIIEEVFICSNNEGTMLCCLKFRVHQLLQPVDKNTSPYRGLHLSAHVFWPLWSRCLSGSCTSALSRCMTRRDRLLDTAVIYKLRLTVSKRDFFPMSHFLFGCGDGCGRGLRNEEWFRGANVLVCESELVWLRLNWGSDMMDGVRGQEWRRESLEGRWQNV